MKTISSLFFVFVANVLLIQAQIFPENRCPPRKYWSFRRQECVCRKESLRPIFALFGAVFDPETCTFSIRTDPENTPSGFSYNENDVNGPSNWDSVNPQCGGSNQSPISIVSSDATVNVDADPLTIDGVDLVPEHIDVTNDGHTLKLKFKYENDQKVKVSGGPLDNPFIVDNIHFHWSSEDGGSEHLLDGKRYSAEMHMVTYNSSFDSIGVAAADPNGLAVLGIFFEVDRLIFGRNNPWSRLIKRVIFADSSYEESGKVFSIRDIIKDVDFKELYSYKGSLTTPGCSENVLWMVSPKPVSMKYSELRKLTHLRDAQGERITLNYRPVQSTNGRTVTLYKF